jgi:lysophospholipase L1-like esterase
MRDIAKNLALCVASLLVGWLVFEAGIRFFIQPSDISYGKLFDMELPPFAILPQEIPEVTDKSAVYGKATADGIELTKGDLWGFHAEDPVLGYESEKNGLSQNGWWQSNNIGARKREDTSREVPKGELRLLVFGDSFAQGSRLKQEEAWPSVLESDYPQIDVVNLAVDGYSMAQSYLRYGKIKSEIDYDLVTLMFVPEANLWRDINTMRYIGGGWPDYRINPRFVVRDGIIEAVSSPYGDQRTLYEENIPVVSEKLLSHLRKFDRFYIKEKYEFAFLLGHSVAYKLVAQKYITESEKEIRSMLYRPRGEALQVTNSIIRAMNDQVLQEGKRFFLVVLPTVGDLRRMARYPGFSRKWRRMTSFLCDETLACLDLTAEFQNVPPSEFDHGYDRTHYGPKINRRIADAIAGYLEAIVRTGSSLVGDQKH